MNQRPAKTRNVETELEIATSTEEVWKALTEAEELVRWFPQEAETEPGPGGFIRLCWAEHLDWHHRIDVWDPPHHLVTSYEADPKLGQAVSSVDSSTQDGGKKLRLAVDYKLEGRGGKTVLRLVHSGFLASPEWDDEYDGVRCGWKFELFGLREYLEHHRGKTRSVAWARAITEAPAEPIWKRLTGKEGLALEGALPLKSGEPYAFKTVHGDSFRGITQASNPPKEFYGTVENMSHAIMRINLYGFQGKHEIDVWLSAYDLPRTDVDRLQANWQEMLKDLFPEAEIK